ncbi:MAG: hypothetical protein ACOYN4_11220 [Bacteroidales bacterium]
MEGNFSELELAFIDDALDQHGEHIRDLLMDAIEARDLIKQGVLIGNITWRVGRYGINPHLEITFADYGRFIDIKGYQARKISPNTKYWRENIKINNDLLGIRSKTKPKQRRMKDTKFYSKTVYGTLNELIGKIMYGFTDAEMERMKKVIASGYNMKGN